jgi:hypothetical protein
MSFHRRLFVSAFPLTATSLAGLLAGGVDLRAQQPVAQHVMSSVSRVPHLPGEQWLPDSPVAGTNGLMPIYRASFQEEGNSRTGLFRGTSRLWASGDQTGLFEDNLPVTLSGFGGYLADANGFVAFKSTLSGNRECIWISSGGLPLLVAAQGKPAPGAGGLVFSSTQSYPSLLALNAGQALYVATLSGATNTTDTGLWLSGSGLVARTGNPAPGLPAGAVYTNLSGHAMLNAAGHVAFYGYGGVDPDSRQTLWAGPPGNLKILARTGDPAPGFEPGWTLQLNAAPFGFNSSGTAVFRASVEHPLFSSREVMYVGDVNSLTLLASAGEQAVGVDSGTTWSQFETPGINSAGEVFFFAGTHAVVSGVTDVRYGLWTGRPGQLRLVARNKDAAPGTVGHLYDDSQGAVKPLLISDSGQVVFKAYLNSSFQTNEALYATDKAGTVRLLARKGSAVADTPPIYSMDVLPETTGSGSNRSVVGSNDGRQASIDASGNLAVKLYWPNDTAPWPGHEAMFSFSFAEAAPVIAVNGQPSDTSGVPGGRAVFQVTALGSRPATYQWKRGTNNIPGATGATLMLSNLSVTDRGNYTVVVTNPQGSVTSAAARLRLLPAITQGPQSQNVNAGQTVVLSLTLAGPGPFTYQWQYKAAGAAAFVDVAGATGATLSRPNITAGQAGRYRVVVSNSDVPETSGEAVVTVAAAGAPILTRVLVPGDVAPGITLERGFTMAEDPVINNSGQIAFEGQIVDSQSSQGTYRRTTDGRYQFATYQAFRVNLGDSGTFAQINSRPITSIEWGVPGNMQLLARTNNVAPGAAGFYSMDSGYSLADDGTTAFRFDTNLGTAAFIGKPGAVAPLAYRSMAAPGLAAGVTFDYVLDPVINPAGTAAFWASLTGTGITADNDTSLWKGTAAGIQRIVSEGDLVPAAGTGVRVGEIRTPDTRQSPFGWNTSGQVAFSTTLAGTGITSANDKAVLAGVPGALQVVTRDGVANGHTFDLSARPWPLINRAGQVAFVATVTPTGTEDYLESLWLWTPGTGGGTRQLIAREGQQAPGLPAGVVFGSADLGNPFFTCALNGPGQLAFTAYIAGPGISYDAQNDMVLYLTTPSGELKLVGRTGSMIDVGGGEMRELGGIYTMALRSGGEDGRPRSLNEYGELVFPALLRREAGTLGPLDYSIMTARLPATTGTYLPAYTAWAATAFPAGTPADQMAPGADTDRDGIFTGLEYLLGTLPRTGNASPITVSQNENELVVTFPRRAGVPDGLETVEISNSLLSGWGPIGRAAVTRTDDGPGQPQTVTVRVPGGLGEVFVRLRVNF